MPGAECLFMQRPCLVRYMLASQCGSRGSQAWLVAVLHTNSGQAKHPAECRLARAMRCRSQHAAEAAAAQRLSSAICAALQWARLPKHLAIC